MLGIAKLAERLGRSNGETVAVAPGLSAFVSGVVTPLLTRSWRAKMTTLDVKLGDARAELATLERQREAAALDLEDGVDGAGKKLDAVVRDVEKAKRRVDDLEAARAGVAGRLADQQTEAAAAHREAWERALARKTVKLREAAAKVDDALDALTEATDQMLDDADAFKAHLGKDGRWMINSRLAGLATVLGARLDQRFGLRAHPFNRETSFAGKLGIDSIAGTARYVPPAIQED